MPVLDTDFVIDLMRAQEAAVSAMELLLEQNRPMAVSAATVMQLHHGIARSTVRRREEDRVETALRGLAALPLTAAIAARAGRIEGDLVRRGRSIGPFDAMIAATALHHGEPVLTRNRRDFQRVDGLVIESY